MNDQDSKLHSITVTIHGKEYPLKSTDADESHLRQVARHVDQIMAEIEQQVAVQSLSKLAILTALNIADELLQLRKRHEVLVESFEDRARKLLQRMEDKPKVDEQH